MSTATEDALIVRNPATGQVIESIPVTPPEELPSILARAREAQAAWAGRPWRERRDLLRRWRSILSRDAEPLADAIRDEAGKPRVEALGEVLTTLEAIRWTIRHGARALGDQWIGPGHQRWLMVKGATLRWRPVGVVGMIGTWNYPLYLNAPPIAQALAAGNAVVWKPSELAAGLGERIRLSLEEAGIPPELVATVQGGPEVGKALIGGSIDKGMFTGGIENGRRVLTDLASRGIPALAELSGFDPAIVLPDAPLESTLKALTWSGFVGAGQTCISLKRIYVVGDPAPWVEGLAEQARGLRIGDPSGDVDLGPLISASARDRFHAMIRAGVEAGARVVAGGEPLDGPGWFYRPTVLTADTAACESKLAGVFGPMLLVRGVPDVDSALSAANAGIYGLAASVWGRDLRQARRVADCLQAGMVSINDAVSPSAHAGAPFGGVKGSGYGRTKGVLGIREFAVAQTIQERSIAGFRPATFPYAPLMSRAIAAAIRWFH